jgi:hypothetical protein
VSQCVHASAFAVAGGVGADDDFECAVDVVISVQEKKERVFPASVRISDFKGKGIPSR